LIDGLRKLIIAKAEGMGLEPTTLYRAPEFQSLDDTSSKQPQPMSSKEVRSTQDSVESAGCATVAQMLSSPDNEMAFQTSCADPLVDTVLAVVRQFYPRISSQAMEEISRILSDTQ